MIALRRTLALLCVAACRDDAHATAATDGIESLGDTETPSDGGTTGAETGDTPSACNDALPARRIRRLSHAEYTSTVADLVHGQQIEAGSLAPSDVVDGYSNNASALLVSGLLADQYRENAEALAAAIVDDLGAFLPCDPSAMGAAECAQLFVATFGRRAFRRPLDDDELAAFTALHEAVAAEDGFDEGIRWVVAAILQAPKFLYRTELGVEQADGTWALTSHEIAEQLAYLVTGSMPDDELAAAADANALQDPEAIAEQAARLLAADPSPRPLHGFVDEWLRTRQLELVTRDAEVYPELTQGIRSDMRVELERVVADVYGRGGTLGELLTASFTWVSPRLAAFYGIDHPGDGFARVELAGERGLLSLGGVLTTHALPTGSSPIHRGVTVRERVLCDDLPPPPPGVANGPPEVDPERTTRERYEQHASDPACAGCHVLIDPIGFGFEHYDGVGRWRNRDAGKDVDATGFIAGSGGDAAFDGAHELGRLLAQDDAVLRCYARQWSMFALGGIEDAELACVADELADAFVDAGGRLDALVPALVAAPGFRLRR